MKLDKELKNELANKFGAKYTIKTGEDHISIKDNVTGYDVEFHGHFEPEHAYMSATYDVGKGDESMNFDLGLPQEMDTFVTTVKNILKLEKMNRVGAMTKAELQQILVKAGVQIKDGMIPAKVVQALIHGLEVTVAMDEDQLDEEPKATGTGEKKVGDYEIHDHGMENASYFQGHGISQTDWEACATGIGHSKKEAFEDALDQLAQQGWMISDKLEKEVKKASDKSVDADGEEMYYHVSVDVKENEEPKEEEAHADIMSPEGRAKKRPLPINELKYKIGDKSAQALLHNEIIAELTGSSLNRDDVTKIHEKLKKIAEKNWLRLANQKPDLKKGDFVKPSTSLDKSAYPMLVGKIVDLTVDDNMEYYLHPDGGICGFEVAYKVEPLTESDKYKDGGKPYMLFHDELEKVPANEAKELASAFEVMKKYGVKFSGSDQVDEAGATMSYGEEGEATASKIKKGDKVEIRNNSILNDAMGMEVASGEVFMVYPDGKVFAFKCEQTGSMERCDLDDGEISVNGEAMATAGLSKEAQECLDLLDGCEVQSLKYENCVGIKGNQVIDAGKVVDTLDSSKKVKEIWDEYCEQEGIHDVTSSLEAKEQKKYDTLKEIVSGHSFLKVDGVDVDVQTANMLCSVLKNLKEENQKTFLAMPISKMATVGWKLIKKVGAGLDHGKKGNDLIKHFISILPDAWVEYRADNDWGSGEDRLSPHTMEKVEKEWYEEQCDKAGLDEPQTKEVMDGLGY